MILLVLLEDDGVNKSFFLAVAVPVLSDQLEESFDVEGHSLDQKCIFLLLALFLDMPEGVRFRYVFARGKVRGEFLKLLNHNIMREYQYSICPHYYY